LFSPNAGHISAKFDDPRMMDDAVDSGCGGQGVLKDLVPLGENKIGGNNDTAPFIAFSQKSKKDLHFLTGLLDIANVIEDDHGEAVEAFEFSFEFIIPFSP
jgi:hypothetical protein